MLLCKGNGLYICLLKRLVGQDKNPQPPKRKEGHKPFTHLDIISYTQHYEIFFFLFIYLLLFYLFLIFCFLFVAISMTCLESTLQRLDLVCACVSDGWSKAKDRDIIYCSFESSNPHYG